MKRLLILLSISSVFLAATCHQGSHGELTGVAKRGKYFEPSPLGMVQIPAQSFIMGSSDEDVAYATVPSRTVSVSAFWMDDTEITNNEYRQFVYWVRDSTARQMLAGQFEEFKITQDRKGNPIEPPILDWKRKLDWRNPDYKEALEPMYYSGNDRIMGRKELDTRKLYYSYSWVDLQQAARVQNAYNYKTQNYQGSVNDLNGKVVPIEGRSSFIMTEGVNVYPDTLVWIRDFSYSFNDPMTNKYFSHPGFDDYPVVGVTWNQAKAFCMWRTNYKNSDLAKKGDYGVQDYRLPSESEWELAARGGIKNSMYPWGGYYTREIGGCPMANNSTSKISVA
jgi:formylglycine-generating enzyme required for sulfatase activity